MAIYKRVLFTVFALFFTLRCFAQELLPGQEEAPPAIFQIERGDANVDLYFLGSWQLLLTASLGFGYNTEDKMFISSPFPDMEPGVIFKQIPDLTLSLWLMNQYFFETSLSEDYKKDTFLLGYQAPEEKEGFLRSLRIGNTDISMGDYGFLHFSDPPQNSIGASARMQSSASRHEVLLRYDPAESREKKYIGQDEVIEEDIHLKDYIRGRMFILPDSKIDTITVYVETEGGAFRGSDGRYYDILEDGKAVISRDKGTVFFNEPQSRRVLVYYTKGGLSVGSPSLGKDFLCGVTAGQLDPSAPPADFSWTAVYLGENLSDRRITADGKNCLLLYEQGEFSPFEYQNTYALQSPLPEDPWRTRGALVRKDNQDGDSDQVPLEADPDYDLVSVFYDGIDYRSPLNRYPFADLYPENYGPRCETSEGFFSHYLRISLRSPASEYTIDPSVIPGSEHITVNGRDESRYRIDYATGKITFLTYIFPTDRITIDYKVSTDTQGGNINFGIGNSFQLLPELTLDTGLGFSWNVLTGTYTQSTETNPGSLLAATSLAFEKENFKASVDTGFSLSTQDTRGIYRILGMEEAGFYFTMSENNALPSSIPAGTADEAGLITLSASGRGELIYKNYRKSTLFTGVQLMPYSWAVPAAQVFPYESGSKTGPYITATENMESDSRVMVMDFKLSPQRKWVGAQVPLSDSPEGINLGDTRSISFYWKGENIPAGAKVFFHIGAVGEDLDGDGTLDEEGSPVDRGYPFNDQASGQVLLIGGGPDGSGNDTLDSEDRNNNEILDWDVAGAIVKKDLTPPGSDWTLEEIPLTQADRAKLHSCRSMRIILYYPAGENVSGRLLIGDFSFESSPFYTQAQSPGTISAREVFEFQEGTDTSKQLQTLYPDVKKIFHSDDSSQKVLEVKWADIPAGSSWEMTGYTSAPVPLDRYRELAFYMKTPSLTAEGTGTFTFTLAGSDGKGVNITLPCRSYPDWQEFAVDLKALTVSSGGVEVPNAEVSYTETSASASKLVITGRGTSAGTMMLDEIHLRKSVPLASAGVRAHLSYSHPEAILQAGDTELFGNFSVDQTISGYLENFAAGYTGEGGGSSFRSLTTTQFDLLFSRLSLNLDLYYTPGDLSVSGGHRIRIPANSSAVAFEDSYNQKDETGLNNFTRLDSLILRIPKAVSLKASQSVSQDPTLLTQDWDGVLSTELSVPLLVKGTFSLQQVSTLSPTAPTNYFSDWIHSYLYYLPSEEDTYPERSWISSGEITLSTTPVGAGITHAFGFLNFGTSERKQKNSADLSLTIPLQFMSGSPFAWTITPGYERTLSYMESPSDSLSFSGDFSAFGAAYGTQTYFYTNPPFAELFSQKAVDVFSSSTSSAAEAVYSPQTTLALTRTPGSFLYDLLVPSTMELTLGRTLQRVEEEIIDSFSWGLSLRATALNLFGRLGAYPLFPFYDTEELTTVFEIQQTETVDIPPKKTTLRLQNIYYFQGRKKEELSMENRLDVTIDETTRIVDTVKAGFTWQFPASFTLPWKFIPEKYRTNLFFKNTEDLELTFGPAFGGGVPGITLGCLLRHTTSLVVTENGHLAGHIALGIEKNTPVLWYFGIEAGIELILSF